MLEFYCEEQFSGEAAKSIGIGFIKNQRRSTEPDFVVGARLSAHFHATNFVAKLNSFNWLNGFCRVPLQVARS